MKREKNIIRYTDPFSILVINPKGAMRKLFCPFRVQTIHVTPEFRLHSWIYVDGVWQSNDDRLLFLIDGKQYPYHWFQIQINF